MHLPIQGNHNRGILLLGLAHHTNSASRISQSGDFVMLGSTGGRAIGKVSDASPPTHRVPSDDGEARDLLAPSAQKKQILHHHRRRCRRRPVTITEGCAHIATSLCMQKKRDCLSPRTRCRHRAGYRTRPSPFDCLRAETSASLRERMHRYRGKAR